MAKKLTYDELPFTPPPGNEPTKAQIDAANLVRRAQEVQRVKGAAAAGIVGAAEKAKTLGKMPPKYQKMMKPASGKAKAKSSSTKKR
jgi:hypothetical protein